MHSTGPFRTLFATVEELGGRTPRSCKAALDTLDAFWGSAEVRNTPSQPQDAIAAAAESGTALSREEARAQIVQLAKAQIISLNGVDWRQLDPDTGQLLTKLLKGAAGDELAESLRPVFARHFEGIAKAAEYMDADTTMEQLVDHDDPQAIVAYKAAKDVHGPALDKLLFGVVRPIAYSGLDMELIEPQRQALVDGQEVLALFFMADPDRMAYVGEVGTELQRSMVAYKNPGGKWLEVHRLAGDLQLNSIRKVQAMLNALVDERIAELTKYVTQPATPSDIRKAARRRPDESSAAEKAQQRMRAGVDPATAERGPLDPPEHEGPGSVGFEETSEVDPNALVH
jgi:hypothetical protein